MIIGQFKNCALNQLLFYFLLTEHQSIYFRRVDIITSERVFYGFYELDEQS
jgi:hypothetical protein